MRSQSQSGDNVAKAGEVTVERQGNGHIQENLEPGKRFLFFFFLMEKALNSAYPSW